MGSKKNDSPPRLIKTDTFEEIMAKAAASPGYTPGTNPETDELLSQLSKTPGFIAIGRSDS